MKQILHQRTQFQLIDFQITVSNIKIKDECNSEITFGFYGRYRYQTDAYEKNSLMILFLDDDSTEENIYDRFKEIIFDPTMSFSHEENEY